MLYQDSRALLIPREELGVIPIVRKKEASPKWKGVKHSDLAESIIASVTNHNLTVVSEKWLVSKSESAMWGLVEIAPTDTLKLDAGQEMNFSLGTRHGNDGEFSVSFAVGGVVSVCSNGMFVGDFTLRKRHTMNLDLQSEVDSAVDYWMNQAQMVEMYVKEWRKYEISTKDVTQTLFRAYDKSVIPLKYAPDVLLEWEYPSHPEFEERTLWSLYNGFTEVGKKMPISTQTTMFSKLIPLFEREYGVPVLALAPPVSDEGPEF